MRSIAGFNNSAVQGSFESIGLNKLGGAIDQASTGFSNDVQYTEATGGTVYGLGQQVYYGQQVGPLNPGLDADKVYVSPGTVNRYIPKIGSDYIDKVPAPSLTVTDNGYVMVKATYEANKYFPRTAEIVFQAVSTPPADTDTISYYPLATITKDTSSGTAVYSMQYLASGNLIVNRLKAGNSMATWWWDVIS
jgi:hypothetical protein